MKPGRELDLLIATKVMEWTRIEPTPPEWSESHRDSQGYPKRLRPFSTDIAAAWEVVEHVRLRYREAFTLFSPSDENKDWFARFDRKWHGRGAEDGGIESVKWDSEFGETAPHAICLAALKAVGEWRPGLDSNE